MSRNVISRYVLMLAGALVACAQADVIYLVNGDKREDVTVTRERFDKIEFEENGLRQELNARDVLEVSHTGASSTFRKGMVAYKSGDYGEAISRFSDCESEREDWIRAHAGYFKAVSLKRQGSNGQAAAAFASFVEAFPEHFFTVDALFGQGECLLADDDASGAQEAFTALADFGIKNDLQKAELYSEYGKGMAQLAGGNSADARRSFDSVVRRGRGEVAFADVIGRASLESGKTFLAEERWEQAQRAFEEILNQPTSLGVLPGVYNGLGKAYAQLGGDENTRKAQLAYLRVVLLFSNQRQAYVEGLRGAIDASRALNEEERAADLEAELARAGG